MKWGNKFCHLLIFFLRTRWGFILLFILTLSWLGYDYSSNWTVAKSFKEIWGKNIDPVISFATLLVAFSVWLSEAKTAWENSLPKKLTVIFFFDGAEVMRCNYAHLDHEADIRNLGQQIGLQMSGVKKLDFYAPNIKRDKGEICKGKQGDIFMHYTVRFTLIKLPEKIEPGKCLLWDPPFKGKPEEYKCQEISTKSF